VADVDRDEEAEELLMFIRQRMTPEQISEGKKLAKEISTRINPKLD
jgi:hypothetical protein